MKARDELNKVKKENTQVAKLISIDFYNKSRSISKKSNVNVFTNPGGHGVVCVQYDHASGGDVGIREAPRIRYEDCSVSRGRYGGLDTP